MSQFQPALAYLLNWEDPDREYSPVPDAGGYAISGINSRAWPSDYSKISHAPLFTRPQLVSEFYLRNFWEPLQLGGLMYQDIANRVLDQAVNSGAEESIKLLQRAIVLCKVELVVDGKLGPNTFIAANSLDPDKLAAAFRSMRVAFYESVVEHNPGDAKYLASWKRRAQA